MSAFLPLDARQIAPGRTPWQCRGRNDGEEKEGRLREAGGPQVIGENATGRTQLDPSRCPSGNAGYAFRGDR